MLRFVKQVERWFWAFCLGAMVIGLMIPQARLLVQYPWDSAQPELSYSWTMKVFLGGILFFTGLKMDFRAAGRELARPWFLLYLTVMLMVVLPLGTYAMARLLVPKFALGVLIVAAMPAGLASSSLTDICKGNSALAVVGTLVTSAVCPVVTPLIIRLCGGPESGAGLGFMGLQALYLLLQLFLPMLAAFLVRTYAPGFVERHRDGFTGLSICSLCLLIAGMMAKCRGDFHAMLANQPWEAAGLLGVMCLFSALRHLAGYFLGGWRPLEDRAALSVNAAYVNNGLGMTFGDHFFRSSLGAGAVLPAILLELPMVLAILPVRVWVARAARRAAERAGQESPPPRR